MALGLGLAVGAGVAALVFALTDSDDPGVVSVDRPADQGVIDAAVETVTLEDRERLPPLPAQVVRRGIAPERGPLTPIAPAAATVESTDVPATSLQDPNDPRGSEDAYALFKNSRVNKGAGIFIAEPTVAAKGDRMLVVWNHGAAFSDDGGDQFSFVDPRRQFPAAAGGYCCDQVAYYVPESDLWVWFIQYRAGLNGANVVRIALAQGDDAFDRREFRFFDISARDFPDLPGTGPAELDYPAISATDKHLFLSINVFRKERFVRAVVVRMPLDKLTAASPSVSYDYITSPQLADFAEGASDTMYFAGHLDTSTLRVWRWADDSAAPTSTDVPHSDFPRTPPYRCRRIGASKGDWCARKQGDSYTNDDRVTGGWVADGTVGFAWNNTQNAERGFPYPFVMVVRVDQETMELRDEPLIWNPRYAFQYAAFSPNARGDVGGILLAGGGERYQTCTTLINDASTQGAWEARAADVSDSDPDEDKAGDYLSVTPSAPGSNIWVGSCMTLHGGSTERDVEIHMVKFGRVKDRDG